MKQIYFNNNKEDNDELCDEAKELGFTDENVCTLKYTGYEIMFEVEFTEDENGNLHQKILKQPSEL